MTELDQFHQAMHDIAVERKLFEQRVHQLQERIRQQEAELYEYRKNEGIKLPWASDPGYRHYTTWTVPICYPPVPLLASDMLDTDPGEFRCYQMQFRREFSDQGVFWRALPFATLPEKFR